MEGLQVTEEARTPRPFFARFRMVRKATKTDAKENTRAKLREALGRVLAGTACRVAPGHRISISVCCKRGTTIPYSAIQALSRHRQ